MRYFVIILLTLVSVPTWACDLDALPFGKSLENVASRYQLLEEDGTPEGYSVIMGRGSVVCSELSTASRAYFTFSNNRFVQLELVDTTSTHTLFDLAVESLGTALRTPNRYQTGDPHFETVWDTNDITAIYSFHAENGRDREYLQLTAKGQDSALKHFYLETDGIQQGGQR